MKCDKNEVLKLYFEKNLNPTDIAKKFNVDKSTITRILQKDTGYLEEKKVRKQKNKKRHIQETKDYIKAERKIKQFKNSAEDLALKRKHNEASAELSDRKRLSNMAFRNWNKSAYSYNEKKRRFEFKEELGRSYDVPKYIKVEVL